MSEQQNGVSFSVTGPQRCHACGQDMPSVWFYSDPRAVIHVGGEREKEPEPEPRNRHERRAARKSGSR